MRAAKLVRELLVGLRERGLDVSRPLLVVIDGSKALRRAVLDVFDQPVIQRCQLHKVRNVKDKRVEVEMGNAPRERPLHDPSPRCRSTLAPMCYSCHAQ